MSTKTIDQLLEENANLHKAVTILIQSAIKNQDHPTLRKWDQLRRDEKDCMPNAVKGLKMTLYPIMLK